MVTTSTTGKRSEPAKHDGVADRVADRAHDVATGIREAGEKLGGGEDAPLPVYASQAAEQVERFSSYVRSRDVGQLIGDVEGFARAKPAIFLGGAFALGLIAYPTRWQRRARRWSTPFARTPSRSRSSRSARSAQGG